MIKGSTHFLARAAVILVIAAGLLAIVWYQENRDDPRVIQTVESFWLDHLYATDSTGCLDSSALAATADSLTRIFSPPRIEGPAELVSVTPGSSCAIVFTYVFPTPSGAAAALEHQQDLRELQKMKFCGSSLDRQRLQHIRSYDFIYLSGNRQVLSFSLISDDCAGFL